MAKTGNQLAEREIKDLTEQIEGKVGEQQQLTADLIALKEERMTWMRYKEKNSGLVLTPEKKAPVKRKSFKDKLNWLERVGRTITESYPGRFSARDIREAHPELSPSQASVLLNRLEKEGFIVAVGFLGKGPQSGKVYGQAADA